MNLDDIKTIQLYPSDHIFGESDRILVCGASRTGKTYLVEQLLKRYAHRFYKIILCGSKNKLLDIPETKNITEYYQGNDEDCGVYNPFRKMGAYDLEKNYSENKKNLCIVLDDLMETVYKSPIVSSLFSKGRHYGISTILLLQSYFPTGTGTNLIPQIRNNSTIQIFTKARSHRDIGDIAGRLEYGKKHKDFFGDLFKKLVQDKRFGYLVVMLDTSDNRVKYVTNIIFEDGTPHHTVHTLN